MCFTTDTFLQIHLLCKVLAAHLAASNPLIKPCGKPADVVFVIDTSTSIREDDFKLLLLPFIQNVVSHFDIGMGQNQTRVGAVTYSTSIRLEFDLKTHDSPDKLRSAIADIMYRNGDTYTDRALKYVSDNMFNSENGGREGVTHVIIVLTDGRSTSHHRTVKEAAVAREKGAAIFAIGVGDADDKELAQIASEPASQFKFKVNDFAALDSIKVELALKTCEVFLPTVATTPTTATTTQASPKEECGGKPGDIFFILDSSSSIWEQDFSRRMVGFVRDVVSNFDISPQLTRVGVMTFSDSPKLIINLDSYDNKRELLNAITPSVVKYTLGGTNTARALRDVRKFGFGPAQRDGAIKIAVVITDGHSWNEKETQKQANLLRKSDVIVFAIGVGKSAKYDELETIASSPREEFVFSMDDFSALSRLRDLLAIKACGYQHDQKEQPVCGSGAIEMTFAFDANTMTIQDKYRIFDQIKTVTERLEYVGGNIQFGVTSGKCAESIDIPMSPREDIIKKLQQIKKKIKPTMHKIVKQWKVKNVNLQTESSASELENVLSENPAHPRKALVLLLNHHHTPEFDDLVEEVQDLNKKGVDVFVLLDKTVPSSYVDSWQALLGKRRVLSHIDPEQDYSGYIMELLCAL
ncbi:collagen alpha-6(VI) chain-like isoform X2 [Biomphalaria glabrata]|uniref:Collagen alpha-6(VI) chain-like isoform X2 n=1 Tax=Biomphalaria glabrata TaxID=6526 RepID=A0A9W2ZVY0_BIOGL|nr:collagen alpha-6(VI) chain-like isoform X2 [Biomphalaria glabrata]